MVNNTIIRLMLSELQSAEQLKNFHYKFIVFIIDF